MRHLPERPDDIPNEPRNVYPEWISSFDWLAGGQPKGHWRPFNEARMFARSLCHSSDYEWRDYCKGLLLHLPKKDYDVPSHPDRVYRGTWVSSSDWLGRGNIRIAKYRSFGE